MKKTANNFFGGLSSFSKLSTSAKLELIGSTLLILSLFLKWFSDIDVYRSGDSYTGLSGPLYLIGINLLVVSLVNFGLTLAKSADLALLRNFSSVALGKLQMGFGFGAMYLLILTNSVYFSPQFGLNVLSKKSEIGVMVALVATVLICVGGYLSFRKKFESSLNKVEEMSIGTEAKVEQAMNSVLAVPTEKTEIQRPVAVEISRPVQIITPVAQIQTMAVENETEEQHEQAYGGSLRTGKTDYERSKAYESLKKMMLKDTLTPEQRRKEREKTMKENAFSANFGKQPQKAVNGAKAKPIGGIDDLLRQGKMKKEAEPAQANSGKKTQMYRMDL